MNMNVQSAPPFFLQDLHDDVTKKEVMDSRFWPIIVAAINQIKDSHDSLVVGEVARFDGKKHIKGVMLTNRIGFGVVGMYMDSQDPKADIIFGGVSEPHRNKLAVTDVWGAVRSSNVKYIVRKIKTPNTDPHNALINRWSDAKYFIGNRLERMLDTGLSKSGSNRLSKITLNNDAVIALAMMHMGDMSKMEVPQSVLAHIESQYRAYVDQRKKVSDYAADIRQMFSNDKWVLLSDTFDNSVIVGAISRQPLQTAVDNYISTGSLPSNPGFKYDEVVMPFKWYKSFADIDIDIRRDIEMQLTMLKLHTKSDKLLIPESGSMETGHSIYPDIGAMTQCYYSESPIIVMDKTV
jgi:hypothetical protein